MTRAADHNINCDWHLDQYDWECTCGAVPNPNQIKPSWLKAPAGPNQQNPTSEEKE
jgi:hypothetical protein